MIDKNKKVLLFIGLTFLLSFSLVFFYFMLGGKWVLPGSLIISVTYMFIPMLVTTIVQKLIYKENIKKPLEISFKLNRWFVVAWLLPFLLAFLALGISLLIPNVQFAPDMSGIYEGVEATMSPDQIAAMKAQAQSLPLHPFWIGVLSALVAGITINAVAGFGEELGWRGLLQKELSYLGFWKSAMVIGFIWGIWHAPIILQGHNYPQHPEIGVFMMVIFTLLLSPIFSYVRLKAKSVIAAAIIHGSLNATAGLPLVVLKGGDDLLVGVTGLAGFTALVLINLGLLIYDRYFAADKIMTGFTVDNKKNF